MKISRKPLLRLVLSLMLAAAVAGGVVLGIRLLWAGLGGGTMSVHGWIALAIGIIGTLLMAMVLMGLAFHSSRRGYDERVIDHRDPGRDEDQD